MNPIQYPLESFYWAQHDEQGNVIREIRDAARNTIFFMRIKGRDFQEAQRFTEELVPLVVRLLNYNDSEKQTPAENPTKFINTEVFDPLKALQDTPIQINNGHSAIEQPRRRGRPPKVAK